MRLRFGNSLKTRIAAVAGLLFLAGICLISLFVTRILHDDMQAMLSKQQLTATSYIARDVDAKLTLRVDSLERVARNMPSQLFTNPPAMQNWLEDRKAIHTLFPVGLMVIPPDGGPTIGEAPRLESRPKSFADRDWFIGAKTSRQSFISRPLITRATGEPALVIAVPVADQQDGLLGIVAGVTPLTTPGFLNLILGARPGRNGSYQLVAPRDGLFVLTTNGESAVRPLPERGRDPILDAAVNGLRDSKILRNSEDQDELVSIVEVPRSGWLLIARQPSADAFEPVTNTLRNSLVITVMLAIPVIMLLLAALHRLLQPLASLATELHAMADGMQPMHPLNTTSADEVSDVARSFNLLQDKLLAQERQLATMAHHDTLTGLPNRRLIHERLGNELARIRRNGLGLALLFLDLDGFKPVNDRYGHHIGDLVLKEIATRLRATVREMDTLARLGGDEFLILLSETEQPLKAAERVAQQCIEMLAIPFAVDQLALKLGVSIGIATCTAAQAPHLNPQTLISHADHAMYRAKAEGRNRYAIHTATDSQPTS